VKLIVGLGNPGKRYERTRHNVGFLVIDWIAAQNKIAIEKKHCGAVLGEGVLEGKKVLLVKPQMYMNRSGEPVADLAREYGLGSESVVVINDDLDLPFGRIRIRPSGSPGGHRGLLSITESLSGAPFERVRIGIGRPPEGMDATQYVLDQFNEIESEQLTNVVQRAASSVSCLVRDGIDRAMAMYNGAS
jgi:peptidyl-tRNA hydrolase, PTH1 family